MSITDWQPFLDVISAGGQASCTIFLVLISVKLVVNIINDLIFG